MASSIEINSDDVRGKPSRRHRSSSLVTTSRNSVNARLPRVSYPGHGLAAACPRPVQSRSQNRPATQMRLYSRILLVESFSADADYRDFRQMPTLSAAKIQQIRSL